jgi:hypothetical protein
VDFFRPIRGRVSVSLRALSGQSEEGCPSPSATPAGIKRHCIQHHRMSVINPLTMSGQSEKSTAADIEAPAPPAIPVVTQADGLDDNSNVPKLSIPKLFWLFSGISDALHGVGQWLRLR